MRTNALLSLVVVLLVWTLPAAAAIVPVSMTGITFDPAEVVVSVGDTVQWTNNSAFLHTTTSGANRVYDSLWDSGTLSQGQSFSHVFQVADSFPYFCRIHLGMLGLVVVTPSGVEEGQTAAPGARPLAVTPNPFRAVTTIGPAVQGRVVVRDVSGRAVRVLEPVRSAVAWDGTDAGGRPVPAGVYVASVESAGTAPWAVIVKSAR